MVPPPRGVGPGQVQTNRPRDQLQGTKLRETAGVGGNGSEGKGRTTRWGRRDAGNAKLPASQMVSELRAGPKMRRSQYGAKTKALTSASRIKKTRNTIRSSQMIQRVKYLNKIASLEMVHKKARAHCGVGVREFERRFRCHTVKESLGAINPDLRSVDGIPWEISGRD